jgi:hypothetical protein
VNPDDTLTSVLDVIIPPSEARGMPGAGSLGLAERLREAAPELSPVLDPVLDSLNERARERDGHDFASLAPDDRRELLEAVSADQPVFLPTLLFHVYQAYYAHPTVLEALGMPPRPPYPLGYEIEPDDFGLLDAVRSRKRLYREV